MGIWRPERQVTVRLPSAEWVCILRPACTDDFNIWSLCGWRYENRACCSVYAVLFKTAIIHVGGVFVYLAC